MNVQLRLGVLPRVAHGFREFVHPAPSECPCRTFSEASCKQTLSAISGRHTFNQRSRETLKVAGGGGGYIERDYISTSCLFRTTKHYLKSGVGSRSGDNLAARAPE